MKRKKFRENTLSEVSVEFPRCQSVNSIQTHQLSDHNRFLRIDRFVFRISCLKTNLILFFVIYFQSCLVFDQSDYNVPVSSNISFSMIAMSSFLIPASTMEFP